MNQPCKIARQRKLGNTTVEYALSGMLICLVSIGALLSFSGAFSAKVTDLKTDMQSHANVASEENAKNSAGEVGLQIGDLPDGDNDNLGGNGTNGGDKPFTTGANGNILGSTDQSGTGNSSDTPSVTPQQQNLVNQISNNAHEVARLQELLKTLAKYSKGNREIFRNTTLEYKGVRLNAAKIANLLGTDGMTKKLERLLERLELTGVDDEILDTVNDLTEQVAQGAQGSSETTQDVLTNQPGTTPAEVAQNTDPNATHENAEKICNSTGGDDDGRNCRGKHGKHSRDSRRKS